jgi:hypothetical protein
LPEGVYALVEATLYLATAPKSNTSNDYFKAYAKVEAEGKVLVPQHLQDGNRDARDLGHGQAYACPHEQPGHHVGQQYLSTALLGTYFYSPSQEGYEAQVKDQPARWREAPRKASTTVEWVLARCIMATRPVVERPRRPADRSESQTISECGRVPVPLARPADTDGQNSTHPRRRSP